MDTPAVPAKKGFFRKKKRFSLVRVLVVLAVCFGGFYWWNWETGYQIVKESPVSALATADRMELLSLDCINRKDDRFFDPNPPPYFHNYPILGTAVITDKSELEKIWHVVRDNIIAGQWDMSQFMCFNPRHGIRVIKDGHEVDVLVCFECQRIEVVDNNDKWVGFEGNGIGAKTFNTILAAHGIPPPPQSPLRRKLEELQDAPPAATEATTAK